MVKARDLPIYAEPRQQEYQVLPETSNAVVDAVSVVRKQVWKFSDTFQSIKFRLLNAVDFVKKSYKVTEETSKSVVKFIKTEEGFYPRAGVISVAGLAGLVLARRGGVFKKAIYSGGLMTAAASLCYPYKAVRISKAELEWIQAKTADFYKKETPKPAAVEKVAATAAVEAEKVVAEKEEATTESPKEEETNTAEATPDTEKVDYGQSNPEDKDMYTTRS